MKRFRNVYIEITNACNLSCCFCPKTARAARMMDAVEFGKVLDSVVHRTEYVYLHVVGEPLLHADLDKILTYCDLKKAKIKLTTNGTFLKKNLDEIVSHSSVRAVNISLSCIKNFDNDAAHNYLDDVLFAARILSQNKITTSLRIWIDTDYMSLIRKKISDNFDVDISIAGNRIQRIRDRLLFNIESEFVWPIRSTSDAVVQKSCLGLRRQLAILSDGTVVPCCLDSDGRLALGNIFKSRLDDILDEDRAIKIAKGFESSQAVEPFCQTCTFAAKGTD